MSRTVGNALLGLVIATGVVGTSSAEEEQPSRVEQAIIDYECTARRTAETSDAAYEGCLSTRLAMLRADFGRNLGRLPASDRRTIDTLCSRVGAARGREARVKCLSDELASLRLRRGGAAATAGLDDPADDTTSTVPTDPNQTSTSWRRWMGASLAAGILTLAGAGFVLARKQRRAVRVCRACGGPAESGDFCAECRHKTARAMRRAAGHPDAAAATVTARPGYDRPGPGPATAPDVERSRDEEARRRRFEDIRRKQEDERLRRQQEADRLRAEEEAASEANEHDPFAILGLSPGATPQEIAHAYNNARIRLDPSQTTHLSEEVQAHFKRKAEAVERAYRTLVRPS